MILKIPSRTIYDRIEEELDIQLVKNKMTRERFNELYSSHPVKRDIISDLMRRFAFIGRAALLNHLGVKNLRY